jgi:hypothetical protein
MYGYADSESRPKADVRFALALAPFYPVDVR